MTPRARSPRSRCTRGRLATITALACLGGFAPLPGVAGSMAHAAAVACPAVAAHRGNVQAPENSTVAFSNAVAAGARVVEMDVRFNSTHEAVLMHDSGVDRTTNGSGDVSKMNYTKFSSLKLDTGPNAATLNLSPPRMSSALQAAQGSTTYLVELKATPTSGQLTSLISTLDTLQIRQRTVLSSFSASRLQQVRSAYPDQRTSLVSNNLDNPPSPTTVRSLGDTFQGHRSMLTSSYVQQLHDVGVTVYGWTANAPEAWAALRDARVDGVITDKTREYLAWSDPTAGNCA